MSKEKTLTERRIEEIKKTIPEDWKIRLSNSGEFIEFNSPDGKYFGRHRVTPRSRGPEKREDLAGIKPGMGAVGLKW